jgi:DNA-binding PadR family transcriptional regulator
MRRKKGELLPIEVSILIVGLELRARGIHKFHGFGVAKEIKARDEAKRLAGYGTLYRALSRMAAAGLLASEWEDPTLAAERGRPPRKQYEVTAAGEAALAQVPERTRAAALEFATGLDGA